MSDKTNLKRGALAEERTDFAEDRTLLANERTFSGWARTAMASLGVGIGFHALFRPVEPTWAAKAVATLFILLAMFLILSAERRARAVHERLSAHRLQDMATASFRTVALAICTGATGLVVAIWWLT